MMRPSLPNLNAACFRGTARRFVVVALCYAFLAVAPRARAWNSGGHMTIARIAYERLQPGARAVVDHLLALPVPPAGVAMISADNEANFIHASHWADNIRSSPAFDWAKPEHYIDIPFRGDDGNEPIPAAATDDAVVALKRCVNILEAKTTSDLDKATALRFLIHFVGDIHQPLHAVTRLTKDLPQGDLGGNKFPIVLPGAGRATNLHSYWDGGLGTLPTEGPNYSPPTLDSVALVAGRVLIDNPETAPGWRVGEAFPYNFSDWVGESAALARSTVYTGLTPMGAPDAAYNNMGRNVVDQRLAWAGYRLAALLNAMYPSLAPADFSNVAPALPIPISGPTAKP